MPLNEQDLIAELSKLPTSAKAARDEGYRYYWNPAKPKCKNGHASARAASNWTCSQCMNASPTPWLTIAAQAEKSASKAEQAAGRAAAKAQAARTRAAKARADAARTTWLRAVQSDSTKAGAVQPEGDHSKLQAVTETVTEELTYEFTETPGRECSLAPVRLTKIDGQTYRLCGNLALYRAVAIDRAERGEPFGQIMEITDDDTGERLMWLEPVSGRALGVKVKRPSSAKADADDKQRGVERQDRPSLRDMMDDALRDRPPPAASNR